MMCQVDVMMYGVAKMITLALKSNLQRVDSPYSRGGVKANVSFFSTRLSEKNEIQYPV